MLGPHPVRYWVPKSIMGISHFHELHQGKFDPIDRDVPIYEILEDTTFLDGSSAILRHLSRVFIQITERN